MKIIFLILFFAHIGYASTVRVVERADGKVSVIHPVKDCDFDEVQKELGLEGRPYKDIDIKDLPSRDYRNAWTFDGLKINIDTEAKREIDITKEMIRLEEVELQTKEDTLRTQAEANVDQIISK